MNQLLNVDLATNTYEADFYMWMRWKGDIDPTATYDFVNQTEAWAAKIVPTYDAPTVDAATGEKYQGWHIQTKFVQRLNFAGYPKTGYGLHILIEDNKYDSSQLVYNVTDGFQSGPTIISAVLMHDAAVGELPRVGYFVAIDKVYLLSYLVIFLTLLESAIVYRFAANGDEEKAKRVDRIALIALAALFIIGTGIALIAS